MADAKPGDVLSADAIRLLYRLTDLFKVKEKCDLKEPRGTWVCIDCGEGFINNMMASQHEREKHKHRLAWRCECGNFEAAPQKTAAESKRER